MCKQHFKSIKLCFELGHENKSGSACPTYDSLFEIAPCLTEIYSSLKFCQTVILCDFLSDTDEFLSYFIEFLSNTGCYLDSLLFCQCP